MGESGGTIERAESSNLSAFSTRRLPYLPKPPVGQSCQLLDALLHSWLKTLMGERGGQIERGQRGPSSLLSALAGFPTKAPSQASTPASRRTSSQLVENADGRQRRPRRRHGRRLLRDRVRDRDAKAGESIWRRCTGVDQRGADLLPGISTAQGKGVRGGVGATASTPQGTG
jgi:hypothetical protein